MYAKHWYLYKVIIVLNVNRAADLVLSPQELLNESMKTREPSIDLILTVSVAPSRTVQCRLQISSAAVKQAASARDTSFCG